MWWWILGQWWEFKRVRWGLHVLGVGLMFKMVSMFGWSAGALLGAGIGGLVGRWFWFAGWGCWYMMVLCVGYLKERLFPRERASSGRRVTER